MCLLSPYQQHGQPSGLCVYSQSYYETRTFENHCTVSHTPHQPPTPTPNTSAGARKLPAVVTLVPAIERISEALRGLSTHSLVHDSVGDQGY